MTNRVATYTTKQRKAILNYLKEHSQTHPSAAQIAKHFERGEVTIGRTTVYRQLDKLVREGLIQKYILDNGTGACFQFISEEDGAVQHFHLKCEECGKIIHLGGEFLPSVTKGILSKYSFEVDVAKTIFYGRCQSHSNKFSSKLTRV